MAEATLTLESAAFKNMEIIPEVHTCKGDNFAPPLKWTNAPPGTKSWALIVDDPDAPDPQAPKRTFVHAVLYNIPPEVTGLNQGFHPLPQGAEFGINDFEHLGWDGPCPPKGEHRYFHKLFALDTRLEFDEPPTKADLLEAMNGHILAQVELVGKFGAH